MNYARTRIYQKALELNRLSKQIISRFPPGYAFLADQLRRASSSVALTFGEGHDKKSKAEQHRYFRIARGSAQEVAAIFDVADAFGVISAEHHKGGSELCDHIVRMLFRFRR